MAIADNLAELRQAIEAAERENERDAGSVRLIAVSKTHPIEAIRQAMEAGQLDFGENRVQELVPKAEALPQARWHLVGQLQRNKVKYIAGFVHLIHSVDSLELLQEIDKHAQKHSRVQDVLLQINISAEGQKNGCTAVEAEEILKTVAEGTLPNIQIRGLMGIAQDTPDRVTIAMQFMQLDQLRSLFQRKYGTPPTTWPPDRPYPINLTELSMGMSGDWPLAVGAGATMIRVGSAVFGARDYGA